MHVRLECTTILKAYPIANDKVGISNALWSLYPEIFTAKTQITKADLPCVKTRRSASKKAASKAPLSHALR
jgi:hypothetical protein